MALSLFFGNDNSVYDPVLIPTVWDVFESAPSREIARNAKAVASAQIDWRETPEAQIFKADLPGLKREEIKVQMVDGRTLEISGERTEEEVQKGDKWHRVERSRGSFLRRFRLPENANADAVTAQVENGVLTVTVPKLTKPKAETRQIQIS